MDATTAALVAQRAASLEEETLITENLNTCFQEIKRLHAELGDSEEGQKSNPDWRYNRKAEKIDSVISNYQLTLDNEIKTINEKYDVKEKKAELERDEKIKRFEEQEEAEIEKIRNLFLLKRNKVNQHYQSEIEKFDLERKRGIEGKNNEYDTYILKREKEKSMVLEDGKAYLENMPKKITDIRKKRLLQQSIDSYNRWIKKNNEFYKRKPELQIPLNSGLEFLLNSKVEKGSQLTSEEKKKEVPPSTFFEKKGNGVRVFLNESPETSQPFQTSNSEEIPQIQEIQVPSSSPLAAKKAVKKAKSEVTEAKSEVKLTALTDYESFRAAYKKQWGEELPPIPAEFE